MNQKWKKKYCFSSYKPLSDKALLPTTIQFRQPKENTDSPLIPYNPNSSIWSRKIFHFIPKKENKTLINNENDVPIENQKKKMNRKLTVSRIQASIKQHLQHRTPIDLFFFYFFASPKLNLNSGEFQKRKTNNFCFFFCFLESA